MKIWNNTIYIKKMGQNLLHESQKCTQTNCYKNGAKHEWKLMQLYASLYADQRNNNSLDLPSISTSVPFLWTWYVRNVWRECLQNQQKCPSRLKNELIRFSWWKVKVNVTLCLSHSCQLYLNNISGRPRGNRITFSTNVPQGSWRNWLEWVWTELDAHKNMILFLLNRAWLAVVSPFPLPLC